MPTEFVLLVRVGSDTETHQILLGAKEVSLDRQLVMDNPRGGQPTNGLSWLTREIIKYPENVFSKPAFLKSSFQLKHSDLGYFQY